MKRILILTLALWTGFSNFAYASVETDCAERMKVTDPSSHACCHKGPCECAIESRSQEQVAYTSAKLDVSRADLLPALSIPTSHNDTVRTPILLTDFPPEKPPLYTLFSVYRI